jgi:Holliday junction resolvase RusA-like endonuclease
VLAHVGLQAGGLALVRVGRSAAAAAAQGEATEVIVTRATFIPGHARPKGSLEPQIVRGGGGKPTGRVRMVESSEDGPRWRRTIAKHVEALGWQKIDGPCVVEMIFWFAPASVGLHSTALDADDFPIHAHIGDLDKLTRNVLDALDAKNGGAGVYADDRQVVGFGDTTKRWAMTHLGEVAGLGLKVWPVGRVAP